MFGDRKRAEREAATLDALRALAAEVQNLGVQVRTERGTPAPDASAAIAALEAKVAALTLRVEAQESRQNSLRAKVYRDYPAQREDAEQPAAGAPPVLLLGGHQNGGHR